MTTTCEYTRISLYFVPYVYLVNFSLLYQLIGSVLQFYTQIVKSKNQPYPIWIRFVRVRHTGVYRVPHAVGRFHPTRTFTKMVGMENFAISTSCLQNRPSTFDITSRLNWLGMMESNHHKQIQSLPHYHYANPQLLKIISFYVILYYFF